MKFFINSIIWKSKYKKYITRQQDSSDCGIACLNSILRYYGIITSMENLRLLSGTTKFGTSILGLCQAASEFGIKLKALKYKHKYVEVLSTFDILLIPSQNNSNHFILILDKIQDYLIIMDPKCGIQIIRNSELEKIWKNKITLKIEKQGEINHNYFYNKNTDWLIKILKEKKTSIASSAFISFFITILNISTFVFLKILIDQIFPESKIGEVFFICGLILSSLILKTILTFFRTRFNNDILYDLSIDVMEYFSEVFFSLPKSFFRSKKTGELTARFNDVSKITDSVSYFLNESIKHVFIIILSLVFIFIFSIKIGIIVATTIPIFFFASVLFWKRIINLQTELMSRNALKTGNFINMVQGVDCIKVSGKETFFSKNNMIFFRKYQRSNYDVINLNASLSFTIDIIIAFALLSVLVIGSISVLNGNMLLGEMVAIYSLFLSLTPSVVALPFSSLHSQNIKVAANRINELRYLFNDTSLSSQTSIESFNEIIFNNVQFSYAGNRILFDRLNFKIKKNEFVCFIGESGIGKTTLINLILGFYNPTFGNILINNKDLTSLDLKSWRNCIGLVEQNVPIFNGSVAFNISLNDFEDIECIVNFCMDNGFHDLICNFPNQYQTPLGDYGIELSDGQKQLIGIARALYKNPELLILDEPSSALDYKSEQIIYNIIKKNKYKITIVLITHKFNITYLADIVYIVENGKISKKGNHHELLCSENFYSSYYNLLIKNTNYQE